MVGDPSAITATARSQEKPMLSDLQTGSAAGHLSRHLLSMSERSAYELGPRAGLTFTTAADAVAERVLPPPEWPHHAPRSS